MILRCTCRHDYQNKRYGPRKRVHNWAASRKKWRCTVCGSEKEGLR